MDYKIYVIGKVYAKIEEAEKSLNEAIELFGNKEGQEELEYELSKIHRLMEIVEVDMLEIFESEYRKNGGK